MVVIKKLFFSLSIIVMAALGLSYFAPSTSVNATPCSASNIPFIPSWQRGLECEDNHVVIDDQEDAIANFVWTIVLNVLDILFRITGILAICVLIYNGYLYLTSAGDSSKISKAKTGLMQAIIGLAIVVLASTIIYFVIGQIQSNTLGV